jgi:hypothetical protein
LIIQCLEEVSIGEIMHRLDEILLESTHFDGPMAIIRTDGHTIEIVEDHTGGKLAKDLRDSYERLVKLVRKSSHLTASIQGELKDGLKRFELDTGDVVEVTADGKSALLNGALLPNLLKGLLFDALNEGKVSVHKS